MQRQRYCAQRHFRYTKSNNVLKLEFTREATTATGEMLVSAKPTVINLVEAVGTSIDGTGAADDSESEGLR